MNEERERPAAADTRSRVIADCAALLPLARSACAAMDGGDEAEILRLFCGESQKRTLRRLGRLIDDLLFAAIKANQYLLQLRQVPSALLRPLRSLVRLHSSDNQMREAPAYEVSVADAAEALGVSEQTVRNWDQNGCPFDPNYPGRFNAIIFYQWAQTFRSLQNFRREAKKRAVLMNRPA